MNIPKPSNKPKDQYPVRLRSPKDENDLEFMFLGDEFSEILSILAEPDDETSIERVDQLLTQLGLLSNRPTSNQKFRVLLSSFLIQAKRLQDRQERKGSQMIIGIPSTEDYWRVKSKVGYKLAQAFKEALIFNKWIKLEVQATINLHDKTGNVAGYLIANHIPDLIDGL